MADSVATAFAAAVGALATGAYLNAKHHIAHDLKHLTYPGNQSAAQAFVAKQYASDRMLTHHFLKDHAVRDRPNQLFLIFEDREWTYSQFYNAVTRVGNWLLNELGIERGEIVALDGENSPEWLIFWHALEGIGAVPSFVNSNLSGNPLLHCVKLCGCRYVLADADMRKNISSCEVELTTHGIKVRYYDSAFVNSCIDETPLPEGRQQGWKPDDNRAIIYTSGTTGFPKGVGFPAARYLSMGFVVSKYLRLTPSDRFYTCMPLYHGAANALGMLPCIQAGCTVVLGRKFSHKRFWPEVRTSQATIVQYIGELCRYLVNAPPSPLDKQHNVKMVWGNGMRPDVWERFRDRFGIPVINELYAGTDAMGGMFNENKGPFSRHAMAVRGSIWHLLNGRNEVRVKIDADTEDILRNADGHAVPCKPNEAGEVVHRVDPKAQAASFRGYFNNPAATEKRFIRDLFTKGDMWFRSGDMMRVDSDGRVFFVDRLGDTFRWRGENVSTVEVSDLLGKHPQIAEANVYGVSIPNADGRCGCAAIVLENGVTENTLDLQDIARHNLDVLPRYAVPLFIRLMSEMDHTGTMKLQKGRLKKDGIDLNVISAAGDKLFWLAPGSNSYTPFGKEEYEALDKGQCSL